MRTKKRYNEEERQKRTKLIMALVICFVMVFSILGIYVEFMNPPNTVDYKDLKVSKTSLGYTIKNMKKQEMLFDNFPNYIETVNASFYRFSAAMITFNPNEDKNLLPYFERSLVNMQMNFVKINVPTGLAVSESPLDNTSAYAKYPVLDCNYENITMINLVIGNFTGVVQNNNCIIVSGTNGLELLLAKDALMYKFLVNN